jgi:hypothetical protein
MKPATKQYPYIVARRTRGQGRPDMSEALTRHTSYDAARKCARKINSTGSDVEVYHFDFSQD